MSSIFLNCVLRKLNRQFKMTFSASVTVFLSFIVSGLFVCLCVILISDGKYAAGTTNSYVYNLMLNCALCVIKDHPNYA